jgi:polyisoprenoid-binding protein YceI
MNKIAILLSLLIFSFTQASFAKSVEIDTRGSNITWTGSKVSGQHWGDIEFKSGSLKMKGSEIVGGSFIIDMTKISVTDVPNPEWNKKLVDHLKNADFFNVEKHGEAKLEIKNIRQGKGGVYDVDAELTILNIKKPVSFQAMIHQAGGRMMAYADVEFNRVDYGIKYKSKSIFKKIADKAIMDEVQLNVFIVTKK